MEWKIKKIYSSHTYKPPGPAPALKTQSDQEWYNSVREWRCSTTDLIRDEKATTRASFFTVRVTKQRVLWIHETHCLWPVWGRIEVFWFVRHSIAFGYDISSGRQRWYCLFLGWSLFDILSNHRRWYWWPSFLPFDVVANDNFFWPAIFLQK